MGARTGGIDIAAIRRKDNAMWFGWHADVFDMLPGCRVYHGNRGGLVIRHEECAPIERVDHVYRIHTNGDGMGNTAQSIAGEGIQIVAVDIGDIERLTVGRETQAMHAL